MSESKLVSIIIRTKNEERWIDLCLDTLTAQSYQNFEVIIVDNNSTDYTLEKISLFKDRLKIKIIFIENFLPGAALNLGVKNSSGEVLVFLSGHCIPVNNEWLRNLITPLDYENIAGVYGRQEPLSFTNDLDKRDLLAFFGLDPKVQVKDTYFHNANSTMLRSTWDLFPFDEEATNIEDRLWAIKIIESGLRIYYQPEASVYHWHGVNHSACPIRAKKIVKVLESAAGYRFKNLLQDNSSREIVAFIPVKNTPRRVGNTSLLEKTISLCLESNYIKKIVVTTSSKATTELASKYGADVVIEREEDSLSKVKGVFDVYSDAVEWMYSKQHKLDICVLMEEVYPFRSLKDLDSAISAFIDINCDSLVSVYEENRGKWEKEMASGDYLPSNAMLAPRALRKDSFMINMPGYLTISYPDLVRRKDVFGGDTIFKEITSPLGFFALTQSMDSDELIESLTDLIGHN